MTIYCVGDMATITVQGYITRGVAFWNKKQFRGLSPVLHTLNGILYGSTLQGDQGIGASLISSDVFPLSIPDENNQLLNLSFRCSRFYIQRLEEERAKNPSSNLSLSYTFWSAMNLVPSVDETHEDTIPMRATYQDRILHIKSRQGSWISISRSHWSDMLTAIDFPQRRYFELPTLKPQEGAEELNKAIEHLNEAYKLSEKCRAVYGGSGSLMMDSALIGASENGRTRPFTIGQVDPTKGFVHVFDDTSLEIVMRTLDTITDFVQYLTKKERFMTGGTKVFATGEEELLAYYLKDINAAGDHDFIIPPGKNGIFIAEGLWDDFLQSREYKAQQKANGISYVWDGLIEKFNTHILGGTQYYSINRRRRIIFAARR